MMHQIRKMVGLTIAVMRGETTEETIDRTFKNETVIGIQTTNPRLFIISFVFIKKKIDVPMAPGLGLVLDKIHYEKYDEVKIKVKIKMRKF